MLVAIEKKKDIAEAVARWRALLRRDAEIRTWQGEELFWRPQDGFWAFLCFLKNARDEQVQWNPFGLTASGGAYRRTMTVQINPPVTGINTNVTGLLAADEAGRRWICHKGHIHTPERHHINAEVFDRHFRGDGRDLVTFSDRPARPYHRVACLDDDDSFAPDLGWFVKECDRIRHEVLNQKPTVSGKSSGAADTKKVIQAGKYKAEFSGELSVAGRGPITVVRWHGKVVDALAIALKARKHQVSAERFSALGPDLYVVDDEGDVPYLFEAKTGTSSQEIFTAVGQLAYYNRLMGMNARKILVVPSELTAKQREILEGIELAVVTFKYEKISGKVTFYGLDKALLINNWNRFGGL